MRALAAARERTAQVRRAIDSVTSRLPWERIFVAVAAGLLAYSLLMRYLLVDLIQVNWDEFNFLRSVYVTARGEQTHVLQSAHGHLFSWLLWLRGHELDQILAARRAMFFLAVAGAVALGFTGKQLIGGSAGLFAAFVYGSFGYVLRHGTAFRYDSILVACYLAAAAVLLIDKRPRLCGAIAGVLGAVAVMVSIKAVFLLIPLAALPALGLLDSGKRRSQLVRLASFVITGLVCTAAFYLLHRLSLAAVEAPATTVATSAADQVINLDKPWPKAGTLVATLRWDSFKWALVLVGLIIAGGDLHRRESRVRALQVLALASPLLTLYFYRNSYPYYYVTIMAGVSLLAGYAWRRIELLRHRPLVAVALALVCAWPVARSSWAYYQHNNRDATADQRRLIDRVHTLFPEPVAYIDRCGMISSFDKVGPFMSSLGMSNYRRKKSDIFPELLREKQPRFLLANSPALALGRSVRRVPRGYRWRRGDLEQLRRNFVHFWGPIWLAGKSLPVKRGEPIEIEIYVPGAYVLESKHPIEIDGEHVQPGNAIDLAAGAHTLAASGGTRVKLRWGASLSRSRERWRRVFKFKGLGLDVPK